MARITPFRPYRYTPAAGRLEDLVTQPYDKITPAMRTAYLERSPYNLVRIVLGEPAEQDDDTDNVYVRAARYLKYWIAEGLLARDAEPAFLAYSQQFRDPDGGESVTRRGFIGLGAVEEYSAGIVHRHEQTLSGPKKDRLELLRATRAHFGQIFMLYEDPELVVDNLLDRAAAGDPLARVCDEYGTVHSLWRVAEAAQTSAITRAMDDKKLIIADGHHRYETALAYRDENPGLPAARWVMMTLVNTHAPGLKILATHRLVHGLHDLDAERLAGQIQSSFRVSAVASVEELSRRWARPAPQLIRIGVVVSGANKIHLLEAEREPGQLDVTYLHEVVLDKILGIDAEAVREQKNLTYVRGLDEAVAGVRQGDAQVAFLLEPTSIRQVADVSFAGGVMPQKSTDFFPKLLSGLAIYKLDGDG